MKKSILVSMALVAMAGSTSVMANDTLPSYDYLQIGLEKTEGTGDEQFRVDVSKKVYNDVFVRASWTEGLYSDDLMRFGVGYAHTLPQGFDLYGGVSYVHYDLSEGSESGYDLFGGARYMVMPRLEINAEIVHTDIDDYDFQVYALGARYHFGNFSVAASYGFNSESDAGDVANLGVAWHF